MRHRALKASGIGLAPRKRGPAFDEIEPCREAVVPERQYANYANYLEVGHNSAEFVLDFGQLYSEAETPQLHSRLVTTPAYAKAMLQTLQESIIRYEAEFGHIE